ncbi:MAG: glycoside hydrolase family 95 protein [Propionibacteriaceae bacterium]|jgi:alpha-L-fucosidase 2|nr:glycoside hydrolase family 95 protein [Propionibacteriaceae bacterium]
MGKSSSPPAGLRLIGAAPPPRHHLALWYRQPADTDSLADAKADWLPIGNGRLAAMLGGGLLDDRIQLNEESLWTGGPVSRCPAGENSDELIADHTSQGPSADQAPARDYTYGYNAQPTDRQAIFEALAPIRGSIDPANLSAGGASIASQIEGNEDAYGAYQNFGWLSLAHRFRSTVSEVVDYRRELDLVDGLARVSFKVGDCDYLREYFASAPDQVIVIRLMADQPGQISFRAALQPGQVSGCSVRVDGDGWLRLDGALADNGLRYAGVCRVLNHGGQRVVDGDAISVDQADSATIIWSAGTDYRNAYSRTGTGYGDYGDQPTTYGPQPDQSAFTMTYRSGESAGQLQARVGAQVAAASVRTDADLLARHLSDYQALFGRVRLDLGGASAQPTDELLAAYPSAGEPAADRLLETLLYQYGRYLLIASSRMGSRLPANLQGIWNNSNTPAWNADYHYNINLEMNYWPVGPGNLLETLEPLQKFAESLRVTGRYTAQKYSYPVDTPAAAWQATDGSAGWTVHTCGNPFGLTAPGHAWHWGWSPASNAFLSQNLYQYLQYGGDLRIFKEHYWPIIREAALMWTKALLSPDQGPYAGKYLVVPGYSPEHGPLTLATAYDQQLVADLFTLTIASIDQLGLGDDDGLRRTVAQCLVNLWSPAQITTDGHIREWTAYDHNSGVPGAQGEGEHRHLSHLIGFYPGWSLYDCDDPTIQAAVMQSLQARGLAATGWSMGWKLNLWARARRGDVCRQLISNLISQQISRNLFDQHPPFQIDGNFGYTAGVHEMLLQCHRGVLELLPALPDTWPDGSVEGLRSVGGHTVSLRWAQGQLDRVRIQPFSSGPIVLGNPAFTDRAVTVNGSAVTASQATITLVAQADQALTIIVTDQGRTALPVQSR